MIEFCLKKPVLVSVAVLFVILGGIWALLSVPIQLTPDVELPTLTVRTIWPGASPYEIEREILGEQEKYLKNITGLKRMTGEASTGQATITLEFEIGTDLDDALLRASNQLNQVLAYPENALRPIILSSGANAEPVIWSELRALPENPNPSRHYQRFAEDVVKAELEKIPGVSESRVYGGENEEMQIRFDEAKLSSFGISIPEIIGKVRAENLDVSAGKLSQGKREYTIRTLSAFHDAESIGDMILKYRDSGPVRLRDVADVGIGFREGDVKVMSRNGKSLVMPVYRETGTNVLEITQKVRDTIDRLNRTVLAREQLFMEALTDPTYYINSAIDLVLHDLYVGGILAIVILYLFLGNFRSSLVVALSIPISIIGTFVALKLLGRNINVISLAGLAFAVGLVVDDAIVVLENIDKWRSRGKGLFESCLKATQEVYLAILAASLTTVAVFLPVVFVKDEAGQLFKDISIAICVSIMLSLAVATTVIPPFYRLLMGKGGEDPPIMHRVNPYVERMVSWFGKGMPLLTGFLYWTSARVWRKAAVVLVTVLAPILAATWLAPRQEYLPTGNRNLLLAILFPPPGYSPAELERVGEFLIEDLRPQMSSDEQPQALIERVFFVGFGTNLILGAVAKDPRRVKEMFAPLNATMAKVPGMFFITTQTSLFASGLGAGRSIDVEFYGQNVNEMAGIVAGQFMKVRQVMPGSQVRPIPSFEVSTPEVQIIPNLERAAKAGLTAADVGLIVDIYNDGRKIDDFTLPDGDQIDLVLMSDGRRLTRVDDFFSQKLLAPTGAQMNLASIADIKETVGPNQINHIGEDRAFILRVIPPETISLEAALRMIEAQIIEPARQEFGALPGFRVEVSGQADAFTRTRESLQSGFILALAITFLLMVILFEDVIAPVVVMGCIPIAAAGGLGLIWLVNHLIAPQPLDVLTMLGFLMLVGIVVKNPVLLVDRALTSIRGHKMKLEDAIIDAVKFRARPIFMTTMTTTFGLVPLVLFPGDGSELYRGLGSAVLGGLILSTFVTLIYVPALFLLIQDAQNLFRSKAMQEEEDLLPKLTRGMSGPPPGMQGGK